MIKEIPNKNNFDNEPKEYRKFFNYIFADTKGVDLIFQSPFGNKPCIYSDFTASGRALEFLENYMTNEILPYYANIHSSGVLLADNIQAFREESRRYVKKYTDAHQGYNVIFTGQGATSAINKLNSITCIKEYASFYKDLLELSQTIKMLPLQEDKLIMDYLTQNLPQSLKIKTMFKYLFKISNDPKSYIDRNADDYNPDDPNLIYKLLENKDDFEPIVFYSELEHNSNRLTWLESGAKIIKIENHSDLKNKITPLKNKIVKFGSFSAASNVTGKFLDVDKLALIMHQNKGFAFFDYASGAPYLQMKMNGPLPDEYRSKIGFINDIDSEFKHLCYKDALFFSPHKFLGGNDTPGVLICHENIVRNILFPSQPGGGTVDFVTEATRHYTKNVEAREEGGTPDIAGSIRIGLATYIRSQINHLDLAIMDEIINKEVTDYLKDVPNLKILRDFDPNTPHLPIYSFIIEYKGRRFHHNYISCLLNDLFGIQSRPGCSCAPLLSQKLLGYAGPEIQNEILKELENKTLNNKKIYTPGFTRLNFPYFYPFFVIRYICKAIEFVSKYADKFLGLYDFDEKTGKFFFKHLPEEKKEIHYIEGGIINIVDGKIKTADLATHLKLKLEDNNNFWNEYYKKLVDTFNEAEELIKNPEKLNALYQKYSPEPTFKNYLFQGIGEDKLRWFLIYDDIYPNSNINANKILNEEEFQCWNKMNEINKSINRGY